jgi:hypothetical protein
MKPTVMSTGILFFLPTELLSGDCSTAIIATYSMPAATFHPD